MCLCYAPVLCACACAPVRVRLCLCVHVCSKPRTLIGVPALTMACSVAPCNAAGLPTPRIGHVMGILGSNGTGKSTAVGIL